MLVICLAFVLICSSGKPNHLTDLTDSVESPQESPDYKTGTDLQDSYQDDQDILGYSLENYENSYKELYTDYYDPDIGSQELELDSQDPSKGYQKDDPSTPANLLFEFLRILTADWPNNILKWSVGRGGEVFEIDIRDSRNRFSHEMSATRNESDKQKTFNSEAGKI